MTDQGWKSETVSGTAAHRAENGTVGGAPIVDVAGKEWRIWDGYNQAKGDLRWKRQLNTGLSRRRFMSFSVKSRRVDLHISYRFIRAQTGLKPEPVIRRQTCNSPPPPPPPPPSRVWRFKVSKRPFPKSVFAAMNTFCSLQLNLKLILFPVFFNSRCASAFYYLFLFLSACSQHFLMPKAHLLPCNKMGNGPVLFWMHLKLFMTGRAKNSYSVSMSQRG